MTPWLGALEGFYGPPFTASDRLDLIRWLGSVGAHDYVYAPKGDPLLRDSWRTPFTTFSLYDDMVAVARDAGVRLSVVLSPGLDWQGDTDIPVLVAKLRSLADRGIDSLGVAFDDVPRGGVELGRAHGRAVAAACSVGGRVSTCPVDYAVSTATPYLQGFCAELPPEVDLFWTGPSIVSPTMAASDVPLLQAELGGRTLVLADNVPVNDGSMSGVLHLGPYPERDPLLPTLTGGLLLNLMPLPLASRIGLACGLRWWAEPAGDRIAQWGEVVSGFPGLLPLARSCRSWLTDPGPDPELAGWARDRDPRWAAWLAEGCRKDLPAPWQEELEPWLAAWELMAFGFGYLEELAGKGDPVAGAFGAAEARRRIRACEQQLFGIRDAVYPVTRQDGDSVRPDPAGIVEGHSLLEELCNDLLDRFYGGTA